MLGLQVNAGKAPLTVNADAGKATNLDADKLDGKSDTDFYAAGSKVADSDKLDGKDSTQIGVNGLVRVSNFSATNSVSPKEAIANCPSGKVVVGTGYDIGGAQTGSSPNALTDVVVTDVFPWSNYVYVAAYEEEATTAIWSVTAYAICAKAP